MGLIEFHDALARCNGVVGQNLRAIGTQSHWHRSLLERWLRYYAGRSPHPPDRPSPKGGLIEVYPGEWRVIGRSW
jgi:hypothetical protein